MARPERRLIVNADDFGKSESINQAVIEAHQNGILTSASLMVNEPAFDEAVELAKQNPHLGVGLHLTLVCGHATLPHSEIRGLVDEQGAFSGEPVKTGLRYALNSDLHDQLSRELCAQFAKFRETGLKLDHVNGHLHMHLHPTVFSILMRNAGAWGITHLRLTRDLFWLNAGLARGAWICRGSHAAIYGILSHRARPLLQQHKIRHTRYVFGLLQHARLDETYLGRLLPRLPCGDSELYSHPSLDEFRHEFLALISPAVRAQVKREEIELIRYQDL